MTKTGHKFHLGLALFLLLCVISFDYLSLSVRAENTAAWRSNNEPVSHKSESVYFAEGLSQGIRDAIETIRPSLVTISTVPKGREKPVFPPLLPEFSDGDYSPWNDSRNLLSFRSDVDQSKAATGVIVSEDGFIWTNSEVIGDSDSVIVTLQNNALYEGKVVLHDPETGLAIVKIEAERLPAAHFGGTTKPRLADWAIAVALNDKHEPITSAGLISSYGGNLGSQTGSNRIRFAFPVNAEFAGCAFVNLSGELIGINVPSSSIAGTSTACDALDTESANELQRKAVRSTVTKDHGLIDQKSAFNDSTATQRLMQKGKEGSLSKLDIIRELFSMPRSEWMSATKANSVRSWLASWHDANDPRAHPVSNASESR